jgi:hypothetical protein
MRNTLAIALLLGSTAIAARGEIIDRVAVTIGDRVLTESMLIEQIRLAAFYDGREPDFSPAKKRQAAETLISQTLLVQEMDDTRYPEPAMKDAIDVMRRDIMPQHGGEASLPQTLRRARITEEQLLAFVQRMLRSLSFIDLRFRRGQTVTTEEISMYYQTEFQSAWLKTNPGKPLPQFDDVNAEIEELIVGRKTDRTVEEWLAQAKARSLIRFRDEVFQ